MLMTPWLLSQGDLHPALSLQHPVSTRLCRFLRAHVQPSPGPKVCGEPPTRPLIPPSAKFIFCSSVLQVSDTSAALSSDLHLLSNTGHLSTWVFLPWTVVRYSLKERLGKYELPFICFSCLENLSLAAYCLVPETVLLNTLCSFVVVIIVGKVWYRELCQAWRHNTFELTFVCALGKNI